jgi:superoxide dismutase
LAGPLRRPSRKRRLSSCPPLGYPYDALQPSIDTATMRIHRDNHYAAYVNNLNRLAEKNRASMRSRYPAGPAFKIQRFELLIFALSANPGFRVG